MCLYIYERMGIHTTTIYILYTVVVCIYTIHLPADNMIAERTLFPISRFREWLCKSNVH